MGRERGRSRTGSGRAAGTGRERAAAPCAQRPRLPDKERLYVTEVAAVLARKDGLTLQGARMRIYRGIENGRVRCVRVLGTLMIPRSEAERIIEGETHDG